MHLHMQYKDMSGHVLVSPSMTAYGGVKKLQHQSAVMADHATDINKTVNAAGLELHTSLTPPG